MDTAYYASLQPPAVYRIDGFGMLEEVYLAVPEAPSWARITYLEPSEVRASSVPVTELDTNVILGAWAKRLEAGAPSIVPTSVTETAAPAPPVPQPDLGAEREPIAPIRIERSLWNEPSPQSVALEEQVVRLSRREALSAFRDLAGARAEQAGFEWI